MEQIQKQRLWEKKQGKKKRGKRRSEQYSVNLSFQMNNVTLPPDLLSTPVGDVHVQ